MLREIKDSADAAAAFVVQAQATAAALSKPELTILQLIGSAFTIAAVAGLARLLNSKKELTPRSVISAILYSGICGVTTALTMANYTGNDPYLMLGICGLVGIGAVSVVDVAEKMLGAGGFKIELTSSNDDIDVPRSD